MHSDQLMTNQQIIQAHDELKLSPAQIAEQFNVDELAVKAILMSQSIAYRKRMDTEIDYNLTDKEAFEAKETLVRLMRHSEDEHLQFKVARYILDDKKGRLDIGKNMSGLKMDVTVFNQYLIDAKDALKMSKTQSRPPAPAQVIEHEKEAINV